MRVWNYGKNALKVRSLMSKGSKDKTDDSSSLGEMKNKDQRQKIKMVFNQKHFMKFKNVLYVENVCLIHSSSLSKKTRSHKCKSIKEGNLLT